MKLTISTDEGEVIDVIELEEDFDPHSQGHLRGLLLDLQDIFILHDNQGGVK